MKRRNFIKLTSTASVLSLVPSEVFSLLKSVGINSCPDNNSKKLVLIQLAGANDGLNTLVPINQYDLYANLRPTLKLNLSGANSIIPLDTTLSLQNQVGLHPVLTGFKDLYDRGLMRIIQGVGYPNMNKSHFKSSDIWLSGGDGTPANFTFETGWMGRFMENYYTDLFHSNFPLGIQLGTADTSLGFHGEVEHGLSLNINNQDNAGYYSVVDGLGGTPPTTIPNSDYGERIQFLLDVDASTNSYTAAINTAFNSGSNTVSYEDTSLSNQLKTVAKFISGGLETKVYLVRLGGFDTHEGQVVDNASHLGDHARLLKQVSEAVNAFITDLNNQNKGNDVLAFTFSEFGRKVTENGNLGTDHGEVAPLFVFGNAVTPGMSGTNVNLSEAVEGNNYQVQTIQHDYRSVFSTILQDWLGAKNSILDATFYDYNSHQGFSTTKVNQLINTQSLVPPSCYTDVVPPVTAFAEIVAYPNPSSETVTVNATADNIIYSITVITIEGKVIQTYKNRVPSAEFTINVQNLLSGFYYFKIDTMKGLVTKKMVIRR